MERSKQINPNLKCIFLVSCCLTFPFMQACSANTEPANSLRANGQSENSHFAVYEYGTTRLEGISVDQVLFEEPHISDVIQLMAKSAIRISYSDQKTLFRWNEEYTSTGTSLTSLLAGTAWLKLEEEYPDLSSVTVSEEMLSGLPAGNLSGIEAGDQILPEALLYGVLQKQYRDLTKILSYSVNSDPSLFLEKMSELASASGTSQNFRDVYVQSSDFTALEETKLFSSLLNCDELFPYLTESWYELRWTKADGFQKSFGISPEKYSELNSFEESTGNIILFAYADKASDESVTVFAAVRTTAGGTDIVSVFSAAGYHEAAQVMTEMYSD